MYRRVGIGAREKRSSTHSYSYCLSQKISFSRFCSSFFSSISIYLFNSLIRGNNLALTWQVTKLSHSVCSAVSLIIFRFICLVRGALIFYLVKCSHINTQTGNPFSALSLSVRHIMVCPCSLSLAKDKRKKWRQKGERASTHTHISPSVIRRIDKRGARR